MRKETKNWLQMVEYDVETAGCMLETGRYVYVIFVCHLAIEKILKALVTEATRKTPPMTHNLIYLLKLSKVNPPQPLYDFISIISNASIPTRYPEDFKRLVEVYPKEIAKDYFERTKEVIRWLKEDERLKG